MSVVANGAYGDTETYVDVPSPVDLAPGDLDDGVAAVLLDGDRVQAHAVAEGHGEV